MDFLDFLDFLYIFIQKLIYMNNIFIYYFNQSSRLLLQNVAMSKNASSANEENGANDFEENDFEENDFEEDL